MRITLHSPGLRARLMSVALVAGVPALIALLYLQSAERRRSRDRTVAENVRFAHVAARAEANLFDDARVLLSSIAAFPEVRGEDALSCASALDRVRLPHSSYRALAVANADGSLFCADSAAPKTFPWATRPAWVAQTVQTRKTVISEQRVGPAAADFSMVVTRPVFDDRGRVVRVLAAALSGQRLAETLSQPDLASGATLTLFNRSGAVLARQPDSQRWTGARIPPSPVVRLLVAGAVMDVREAAGVDGVTRLYVTVPVTTGTSPTDLYLGLGVDRGAAYAESNRILDEDLLLVALVMLTGAVAAAIVGHRFVLRPLKALKDVAKRLAAGDLGARAQLTHAGGISDLTIAVNEMATALEDRQRERTAAEEELRASAKRYRKLFQGNPQPMWVFDRETLEFLEVNQAAIARYGYTREEFSSMTLADIRPSDEVPRLIASLAKEQNAEWSNAGTWCHRLKSGAMIDVELATHALRFHGRAAILVAAHDVSGRTRAERELREAEERMRFTLEASGVGVWESDIATDEIRWSATCADMHGVAQGTFGGTVAAFLDTIAPDDRERVRLAVRQATLRRAELDFEYRTVLADGTTRLLRATGRVFCDPDGRAVRIAGVSIDITQRRSVEEQLRQSQRMEAVGQLAGGVAHDFNNLLMVIDGNADMALRTLPPDSEVRADIQQVRDAAARATQLTSQLLAYSRKQVLHAGPVDVDDLVDRVAPMIRRLIGEDIEVQTILSDARPITVADEAQLEQALINLALNSRDAMPGGGKLFVTTAAVWLDASTIARQRLDLEPGSYVALSVADNGHGMEPEILARVFEPFFTTKEVGKGTGLGLSSVYGTVKQTGGHVKAESAPGRGTTMTLYLPRASADELAHVRRETPTGMTGELSIPTLATILLVEDEGAVRDLISRILRSAGYKVLAADCGATALQVAREADGRFELVLSDVVMPGISIMDMVAGLRAVVPDIPVILMSGYPDAEIARRGLRVDQFTILEKPLTGAVLLEKVHRGLRAHARQRRAHTQPRAPAVA